MWSRDHSGSGRKAASVRVRINGREVANPVVKAVFVLFVLAIAALVAAGVIFIVLPLVGLALGLAMGVLGASALAMVLAAPVLLVTGRAPGGRTVRKRLER